MAKLITLYPGKAQGGLGIETLRTTCSIFCNYFIACSIVTSWHVKNSSVRLNLQQPNQ